MAYKVQVLDKDMTGMASSFWIVNDMRIEGDYVPKELPLKSLSDIWLADNERNVLYLVHWLNLGKPEICIWKIDGNSKTHQKSKPIKGCCSRMVLDNGKLVIAVWAPIGVKPDGRNNYGLVTVTPEF